jgi:hypothetical protein
LSGREFDSGCESKVQGESAGRLVITVQQMKPTMTVRTDDDAVAGLRYIAARKRSKAGVFPYLHASLRKICLIGLIVRNTLYLSGLRRTIKSP